MMTNQLKYYSKQGLWSLFLTCAFPLHFWAILLIFNDVAWVAKRTNAWDAVGVASYGLVFAFIESVIIFLIATLLGFLISKKWDEKRRVALMSALVLILSLWAIAGQGYFLLNVSLPLPAGWILSIGRMGHPVRFLSAVVLIFVSLTMLLPTYLILKSEKTLRFVIDAIERISLLAMFYLFFDLIGLLVLIIRNLA